MGEACCGPLREKVGLTMARVEDVASDHDNAKKHAHVTQMSSAASEGSYAAAIGGSREMRTRLVLLSSAALLVVLVAIVSLTVHLSSSSSAL